MEERWAVTRPYTLDEIKALVRRTAPVWYIHDDEEYLPSSIDWYLDRATLVAKTGTRTVLADGGSKPEDKLVQNNVWPFTGDSADYWLEVPESAWSGDMASARSYVSIRRVAPGFLDISHWFWYPGNGCGAARVRTLAFDTTIMTEERIPLTTLGFHVSDWEKVTVRVTDDADNKIDSVYFAQHAGGHWLKPEQLEHEPTGQFAVYASRSGHASYPTAGTNYTAHIKTAPPGVWAKLTPAALEIWLRNDTVKGSRRIDCAERHEIVSIQEEERDPQGNVLHEAIRLTGEAAGSGGDGAPFYGRIETTADGGVRLREPKWLNYPYRWGPETEQKITHEVVFEALKMAIGPLAIYGAMTFGAMLPLLGAIAGLLVPYFVKMENENGKPGPKTKYISTGVVDEESPPEPDNLFTEAVGGGIAGMVAWVEGAGHDVADWTVARADDVAKFGQGAAGEVADWTTGAANEVASWTTGVANDTADWFKGAASSAGDWATGAANDVASWTEGAAKDAANWAEGAAKDAASWTEGAANTVGHAVDPRNW